MTILSSFRRPTSSCLRAPPRFLTSPISDQVVMLVRLNQAKKSGVLPSCRCRHFKVHRANGVVASVSQVRHHTPPERLHHLPRRVPHTAQPPQLHHVRQFRRARPVGFIGGSGAHRPAVAAAPRRAQHRYSRHTSSNAGLCTVVRQHGFVSQAAVGLFNVVGQRAVVLNQRHAPQALKGKVRVVAQTRRQCRPACVGDVVMTCSHCEAVNITPPLLPMCTHPQTHYTSSKDSTTHKLHPSPPVTGGRPPCPPPPSCLGLSYWCLTHANRHKECT